MLKIGIQQGRSWATTGGVPAVVRRGLSRSENEVGGDFQHPV